MTNTLYCPFCIGKGKCQGMGMIEKKCDHCNGVGYVEAGSKLEEKPNGDTPAPVKTEEALHEKPITITASGDVIEVQGDNSIVNLTERLETVPVELIVSKRRGRPPRTEK